MNEEEVLQMKPSQVIARSMQVTEYNLYLHGRIGPADEYMEHFATYHMAGPQDLIRLWINSPGGDLATTMQYIRHMRECAGTVVAVIGMECASGASAIALAADDHDTDEFSTMLVHGFSYGNVGGAHKLRNAGLFNGDLNEKWVHSIYDGFLSEEEMEDAVKNVDVLIHSDLAERLEKYRELRDLKAEEAAQEFSFEKEEETEVEEDIIDKPKRKKRSKS